MARWSVEHLADVICSRRAGLSNTQGVGQKLAALVIARDELAKNGLLVEHPDDAEEFDGEDSDDD